MRPNSHAVAIPAVEVLCHEWAHALAWNFSLDRLSKTPGLDPVEFDRACHDEAWGSSLFAGLAGVSGGHPAGGVTAVQWALGTVSKTVSQRPGEHPLQDVEQDYSGDRDWFHSWEQANTRRYGLDAKHPRPDDTNWTEAEIRSCCRLASLLDVPLVQAAQNVVPVAVTAGDKIESLRNWASGRCLSADRAGVYSRSDGVSGGRVRRVVWEPGVN